jgi:hypothetical protein
MDQKEYLNKAEKIYDLIEKIHSQKMNFWIENVIFTWQWWLGVFDKPPVFIWMTTTEHRKKELSTLCKGLDVVRIYERRLWSKKEVEEG